MFSELYSQLIQKIGPDYGLLPTIPFPDAKEAVELNLSQTKVLKLVAIPFFLA
jgi:hypothetical protein